MEHVFDKFIYADILENAKQYLYQLVSFWWLLVLLQLSF